MTNFWRRIFALIGLVLALGLGAAAWRHFSQPDILTVAVGPANSDDSDFINAWSRLLAAEGGRVRLKAVPTSGPVESLEKLKNGASHAGRRADGSRQLRRSPGRGAAA